MIFSHYRQPGTYFLFDLFEVEVKFFLGEMGKNSFDLTEFDNLADLEIGDLLVDESVEEEEIFEDHDKILLKKPVSFIDDGLH